MDNSITTQKVTILTQTVSAKKSAAAYTAAYLFTRPFVLELSTTETREHLWTILSQGYVLQLFNSNTVIEVHPPPISSLPRPKDAMTSNDAAFPVIEEAVSEQASSMPSEFAVDSVKATL